MHGRLIILVLLCLGMAGWGAEPAQEEAADPADERATGAQDATRARELTSMLNDGDLSPQEQAIISPWLDQYYCVLVQWETKTGQRLRPQVVVPTVERLQRFAQQVEGRRLSHVSLWREPSKDVRIVTDALARHAVAQIRADLTAIKDEYPELTELRERPYKIGPTTLGYGSRPKSADRGPTFAVFVGGPFMGDAQPPPGSPWRTLLPRQNIEIDGWVGVSDKRLAELLKQTVERNVEPLLCFERLLGGEPVRGVPRSGSAQQDLGETRAHR